MAVPTIGSMSPPDYSSARLRPRRAGFRFIRWLHPTKGPIQHRSFVGSDTRFLLLPPTREVAGALGLTPMRYQSGDSAHEQGISRAGNRRVRAMAIEIAWSWLKYQPQSDLSQWYQKRFGGGGKRQRRIGIVATARRLMIDLWRYLEKGVLPAGARLKAVAIR